MSRIVLLLMAISLCCYGLYCAYHMHAFIGSGHYWSNPWFYKAHASLFARKLTDEQAAEIRAKAKAGEPHIRIAREFGVSRQTVYIILQGKTHKRGT